MNEQELRAELEAEYQEQLEQMQAEYETEAAANMEAAYQALNDYKDKTESKLAKYRQLASRLHMMREQKRMADFQHQEAVEGILKQMHDLEFGGGPPATGFMNQQCGPMMAGCSPMGKCAKKKKNKPFADYNVMAAKMTAMADDGYPDDCDMEESPPKSYHTTKGEIIPFPGVAYNESKNCHTTKGTMMGDGGMAESYKSCPPKNKIKNVKLLAEESGPWGDPSSTGGHTFSQEEQGYGESPVPPAMPPWGGYSGEKCADPTVSDR